MGRHINHHYHHYHMLSYGATVINSANADLFSVAGKICHVPSSLSCADTFSSREAISWEMENDVQP